MASIRWTVGASADFAALVELIARSSEVYATRLAERLLASIELLQAHPRMGRTVPEYDRETVRELIYDTYRVVYQVDDETVVLLALISGRRDMLGALGDEPWNRR
jgi:toxin ParE1/3/4